MSNVNSEVTVTSSHRGVHIVQAKVFEHAPSIIQAALRALQTIDRRVEFEERVRCTIFTLKVVTSLGVDAENKVRNALGPHAFRDVA